MAWYSFIFLRYAFSDAEAGGWTRSLDSGMKKGGYGYKFEKFKS
jgi:hypothetical protein